MDIALTLDRVVNNGPHLREILAYMAISP